MPIIIRKTGFFKKEWFYDDAKEEGRDKEEYIHGFDILGLWSEEFEAFESVTVKEFLDYLSSPIRDELLTMFELLTNCNIRPFIHELNERPTPDNDSIDRIVIEPVLELSIDSKRDKRWDLSSYVGGSGYKTGDETAWSVSWSNWATLKDAQLEFNPHVKFCKTEYRGRKKSPKYKTLDCSYWPTLGDVMRGLFVELTFTGSPEKRKMTFDEIMERKQEIDNGTAKLVELDLDELFGDE